MLFDPKNIQQLNENILRRKIGRSELPYFLKNKGTKDEDSIPQVYIKSIPTLYQVYIKSISNLYQIYIRSYIDERHSLF